MSKPNLLGFSSSVGIYRNKRMRDLRVVLVKQIPRKVPFADMSTTLFQALMAYAAENQIDGDFSDYNSQDVAGIFCANSIEVSVGEASIIWKAFDSVGLLEGGKIRSWAKFNRHFADHEKIQKAKRRAGQLSRKKWEREVLGAGLKSDSRASKNGEGNSENPAQKPVQNPSQKDSPSKQLWVLDQALLTARGQAKRDLLRQKQQLLSSATGVDLSSPAPSPALPPAKPPHKLSAADRERDLLTLVQSMLKDRPEALSDYQVRALVKAGYKLPPHVQSHFRKLLKESDNPVPE